MHVSNHLRIVVRHQHGRLLTDSDQLRELLKFHVAIGRYTTSSIVDDASGRSLHPEFPLRLRITPHVSMQ